MPSTQGLSVNENRAEALQAKHAMLSERIENEQRSPSASDVEIRLLKKVKLQLKEELEGIRRRASGMSGTRH